jgi:Bacterial lipocalin
MRTIIMVFGLLIFHSCTKATDLTTVPKVDINRYLGQWHEIARFPNRFEKGLECVTANYSLKKTAKLRC